jgi:hypothetical protein
MRATVLALELQRMAEARGPARASAEDSERG